jgi:hypothetical protein
MTAEVQCDSKRDYFSWDSSRPEEEMLEKVFGFVIKVKISIESRKYDELNSMLNF